MLSNPTDRFTHRYLKNNRLLKLPAIGATSSKAFSAYFFAATINSTIEANEAGSMRH
jgi:hypothetical protein